MVKFYLNSIQVDAPANWEDFTLKLARDKSIDALLLTTETTLEWIGTGYQYLSQLLDTSGFCGSVELTVTDDEPVATDVYLGRIFLSTCEINEGICSIKTKVEDRSFYAMINNNKGIEADLTAGVSKGGVAITPATSYIIDIHDVSTGAIRFKCYSVRVSQAFRYLIDFMTDGTVDFKSNTFKDGNIWGGLAITTGLKLRLGDTTTSPPLTQFSFKELYEEVKKKIPIGMTVTESAGVYTLRIESIDYFNQSTGSFRFENIEGITTKFNEDKLYASVKVGSVVLDQFQTFPEILPILGWKEEQLFNDINCNVDSELDLVSEWVISSNVIEDCVSNSSAVYDEDLFLINTTLINQTTGVATATDIFQSNEFFYNDALRNINVLQRYANGIPQSALQYFSGTPANFYAWQTSSYAWQRTTTISPAGVINNAPTGTWVNYQTIFDDDINAPGYDPNGVYLVIKNIPPIEYNVFTAPVSAYYTLKVFVNATLNGTLDGNIGAFAFPMEVTSAPTSGLNNVLVRLIYNIRDSTGAVVAGNVPLGTITAGYYRYTYFPGGSNSNGPYTVNNTNQVFNIGVYLNSGDNLNIGGLIDYNNYATNTLPGTGVLTITERVDVSVGSYFTCIGNSTDDTNITVGNINEYIAYEHSFEYPMTATEFTYLKDNSRDLIEFSMFGRSPRYGWVSDLKYNWIKGTASVKLESNAINNNVT